jgi:signal transduction histidine kinase/CheY-like chemotaxis protein
VAAGFDAHQLAEFYDRGNLIKSYEIGERSMSIEYPYRTGIGEINWCHNTISLIKRPYSNDIIAFSIVTDISQEKLTADIISTLVQKKYDSVGTVDAHTGKLVAYISNRRVLNSVMIEKGDSFEKIIHDYNEKFVIERDREMCNKVLTLDNILKHLNEHDRYAVFFSVYEDDAVKMKQKEFFYLDKENQMVSFVSSDITEAHDKQVKQEEILRIALKQAEQANAAKSSFLSRMSHDMRTPLNGIIGLTYLTEEMDLPQKAQENLQKIDTSSKFLLGLINDILDMAKAESGKVVLKPEPYSIDEFNKYLDAVIRPLCKERKLNFVLDESGVMTRIPLADKLRINQIIFNVLSNAVKYTPEGGTITYTIQASALPHDRVQIIHTISDTGIGMSEEFQKKLFEPFTQEEQNESGRIQGTGLGLAIVKRMINLMGGTIQVKSTLGKGSTFIITLDFDTVAPGTQPVKIEAEDAEEAFNMEGRRILLCEDNQLNQEIAKMLLTQKGIEVDIADNGKIGVDRFSKAAPQTYDLILMDIRMPVMNGYEAAKAIRQLDTEDAKSIPIIAMTADAYSEDVQKAKDAGMNGHIAKPIDPNHLYETLQKIMKHDA